MNNNALTAKVYEILERKHGKEVIKEIMRAAGMALSESSDREILAFVEGMREKKRRDKDGRIVVQDGDRTPPGDVYKHGATGAVLDLREAGEQEGSAKPAESPDGKGFA